MRDQRLPISSRPAATDHRCDSISMTSLASYRGLALAALLSGCAGGDVMLKPGQPAPPLAAEDGSLATDWRGNEVNLSKLMTHGPVVLVFLRGFS